MNWTKYQVYRGQCSHQQGSDDNVYWEKELMHPSWEKVAESLMYMNTICTICLAAKCYSVVTDVVKLQAMFNSK